MANLKETVQKYVGEVLNAFENDSEILSSMQEYITSIDEIRDELEEKDEIISSLLDRIEILEEKLEDK